MNKLLNTARTKARIKYNQPSKVWFVIVGDWYKAFIINTETKKVLCFGSYTDNIEHALESLIEKIYAEPYYAPTTRHNN